MPTINSSNLSLADLAKRTDPEGRIPIIIEALAETNTVLQVATSMEGNLPTGNKRVLRSALPTISTRRYNEGTTPTKSRTYTAIDTTEHLEAISKIDADLVKLNGGAAFRASEDVAFVEAMGQQATTDIFYGNSLLDPDRMLGLSARYGSTTGETGANVILGGGSGADNCSLWLLTWGDRFTTLITPKGSAAGWTSEDLGRDVALDASGREYVVERTRFCWDLGLSLGDWRYNVRIPNIDLSNVQAGTVDLITLMTRALTQVQNTGMGKQGFFCNRFIWGGLTQYALKSANSQITIHGDIESGKFLMAFLGIPIYRVDRLLSNEALVA
jgi:hypothetical protein